MKAAIIQIGNSQGLRIPKPILQQCGFGHEVEIEVHDKKLIVKPFSGVRQNWETAFKVMHQNNDDKCIELALNQWDEEEWEW